jgi:hypothetical protein
MKWKRLIYIDQAELPIGTIFLFPVYDPGLGDPLQEIMLCKGNAMNEEVFNFYTISGYKSGRNVCTIYGLHYMANVNCQSINVRWLINNWYEMINMGSNLYDVCVSSQAFDK